MPKDIVVRRPKFEMGPLIRSVKADLERQGFDLEKIKNLTQEELDTLSFEELEEKTRKTGIALEVRSSSLQPKIGWSR